MWTDTRPRDLSSRIAYTLFVRGEMQNAAPWTTTVFRRNSNGSLKPSSAATLELSAAPPFGVRRFRGLAAKISFLAGRSLKRRDRSQCRHQPLKMTGRTPAVLVQRFASPCWVAPMGRDTTQYGY